MSDGRCWLAWSEFIPEAAWARIVDQPKQIEAFLEAFRASVKIPGDWNPDIKAHHGPLTDVEGYGRGVVMVLRAWRKAPTDSGICDGTCEMCSRGRMSFTLTGVAL